MESGDTHISNEFKSLKNNENFSVNNYNNEELNEKKELKNSRIETS